MKSTRNCWLGLLVTALLFGAALGASPFQCKMTTVKEKGDGWAVQKQFPVLSAPGALMGVQGIVKDFNARVLAEMKKAKESFLKDRQEIGAPAGAPKMTDELTIDCEMVGQTDQYLSFVFSFTEMVSGAAHPDNWYVTINFTTNGGFLEFKDLFGPGPEALNVLSRQTGALLKKKFAAEADGLDEGGWAPKAENFRFFCLSPAGLRVFFSFYQVGPRPLGAPDVLVPWKGLEGVLTADGKRLLKD